MRCGVVRCGTVRYGTVRYGMVWYGMVWYGTVRYGTVRYGTVRYGTVRYGTVRYGTVRYGMVWYGMVWYGMVWYGMVWYGTAIKWQYRKSCCSTCNLPAPFSRIRSWAFQVFVPDSQWYNLGPSIGIEPVVTEHTLAAAPLDRSASGGQWGARTRS